MGSSTERDRFIPEEVDGDIPALYRGDSHEYVPRIDPWQ